MVGEEHYRVAREVQHASKSLQDIIAILGMDELSEEDRTCCKNEKDTRFLSQPFLLQVFTGSWLLDLDSR